MEKILVVDDEESIRWIFKKVLEKKGFKLSTAENGLQCLKELDKDEYFLVFLDIKLPDMDGLEILKKLKQKEKRPFVIVMTGHGSMKNAVEAMKMGAYDYITKPFEIEQLEILVEKALRDKGMMIEVHRLKKELREWYGEEFQLIGNSKAMQEIYKTIGKVAPRDIAVLIEGESGTGKEMVARAIHINSTRFGKPFITVNSAAIPGELLESELFGYERGAFTGAEVRKKGKFELAHGGTIFLDEIGDMSLPLQGKILRVLQEKEVDLLGSKAPIKVDIRVIAATNRNLKEMVEQKNFREDLFYRLNVVNTKVPPLRERKEDIPLLLEHFMGKIQRELKGDRKLIPEDVREALMEYPWPGNVRELENTLKRAMVISTSPILSWQDFPHIFKDMTENHGKDKSLEGILEDKLEKFLEKIVKGLPESLGQPGKHKGIYSGILEMVERPLIKKALEKTKGNQIKAAKILGINRNTLRKRIDQLNIHARKTQFE